MTTTTFVMIHFPPYWWVQGNWRTFYTKV